MTAWASVICASGKPDQRDGLRRGHGRRQRGGVGHADVLAGQDHEPAGDEPRVLPGLDHAREVVQRGVDVAAADGLDERAGDVVVLVAVAVVAHRRPVDGGLDVVDGRPRSRPGPERRAGCGLERGQRPAGVAAGEPHELVERLGVDVDRTAEPALVGDRALEQRADVVVGSSGRGSAAALRDSSGAMTRRTGSRWWRRSG